ncbi:MAG: ribonuclease III [Armatimonadota bacterium]|nr:ribonuclease III [Armatimonadota bacterium]MDR7438325.1 ribonuclease III [Armatimonadota bacterium]MDR7443353.1 ribonuclease III [Armatimonadota bacterium]MDR7563497.1 ribonuclease III [Armatimonadota bacterium]MDR7567116.1 ribonuclease III [Armatimonadota bacterium]
MPHPSGIARTEQLLELAERLGVRFRDLRILERALVHGSYAHEESAGALESYERLEFLGDAVLNLVVSDHLYRRFPAAREGELARMRARLVSEPTLAEIARSLNLGKYILLGKGEERSGGRERTSLLADVLEAVVGAVYVDAGYGVAHAMVSGWIGPLLGGLEEVRGDFKGQLQEVVQRRDRVVPQYRITATEGPDHAKVFVAVVEVAGRVLGEGRGKSKKEAEQAAAADALRRLGVL